MEGTPSEDAARRADEFVETYESKYRDYAGAALQRLYAEGAAIRHELAEPLEQARTEYEQHLRSASEAISSMSLPAEEIHSIQVRKAFLQQRYRSLNAPAMRLDGFLAEISSLTVSAIEAEIEAVEADVEQDREVVDFYDQLLEEPGGGPVKLAELDVPAEAPDPGPSPGPSPGPRRGLFARLFGRG